jgi:hypothetical protein
VVVPLGAKVGTGRGKMDLLELLALQIILILAFGVLRNRQIFDTISVKKEMVHK